MTAKAMVKEMNESGYFKYIQDSPLAKGREPKWFVKQVYDKYLEWLAKKE